MTWLKRNHLKELENTGENLGSLKKSHINFPWLSWVLGFLSMHILLMMLPLAL